GSGSPYTVYSMSAARSLDRPNLSESIADAIRERVVLGSIAPGVRINETHLASELGVSRTPLREGLMRLASEGCVRIEPRRGFFATPLSIEEFEQLMPVRALLDPEALRLAGLPSRAQIVRLQAINRRLEAAREPERVIAIDDAWHLELLAHSTNPVLVGLIRQFMARTHRYELVLMRERGSVVRATREHREVQSALGARDLERACRRLRQNLQSGSSSVLAWLKERSAA